eukprot:12420541-Ditylum_brightwellii.AAC.1
MRLTRIFTKASHLVGGILDVRSRFLGQEVQFSKNSPVVEVMMEWWCLFITMQNAAGWSWCLSWFGVGR